MSDFDFQDSRAPDAQALQGSHPLNPFEFEREIKELALELFSLVAKDTFDASVLGAAHLGSFDLVRNMVTADGLVLLKGEREEAATRYLYRAWKSGDVQKRGLHFLRTYLQMLFPGEASVTQMWHDVRYPYGQAFIDNAPRNPYWFHFLGETGLKINGAWKVGRPLSADGIAPDTHSPDAENLILTTRVEILLGLEAISGNLDLSTNAATSQLINIIRSVIPARLVPIFRFWLRMILYVTVQTVGFLAMRKSVDQIYPWCGRVISDHPQLTWKLGVDGRLVKLGLPLGSFKLGEMRGAKSVWRLKACRVESSTAMKSKAEVGVYGGAKVGQLGRHIDGTWRLNGHDLETMSYASMKKSIALKQDVSLITTFHDFYTIQFPGNPDRLGKFTSLDGSWRLDGSHSLPGPWRAPALGGFQLMRPEILTESSRVIGVDSEANACPARLSAQSPTKLRYRNRRLNGDWPLGAESRFGEFSLNGVPLRSRKMREAHRLGRFKLTFNELAGLPERESGDGDLPLDGTWRLGSMARPGFSMTITREVSNG